MRDQAVGYREDDTLERTTIAEAAKKLEVTQEAIRARIRRGTIEHDKDEAGKTYVYLTEEETHNQSHDQSVVNGVVNDYITALKSEIESLKKDRELWQEEAKRKDTIIMALTNRIPELEAPSDATEGPVSPSDEGGKGSVPPEARERSWWQRIFR
jgi:DNA-binding transcriptional MerR regulator